MTYRLDCMCQWDAGNATHGVYSFEVKPTHGPTILNRPSVRHATYRTTWLYLSLYHAAICDADGPAVIYRQCGMWDVPCTALMPGVRDAAIDLDRAAVLR